jgi:Major Facilitator Superfamily
VRSLVAARPMMANRPLAALLGASALSGAGDWVYLTALPVLVFQRTADPALVGVAAAARLVPFFLLSMPAGWVADRFDRRAVLLATELVRCIAMLAIAALCATNADIVAILGLTVIAAAAGTFSMPAIGGLVPELAGDDLELGRANAIRSTLDSLAGIVAPASTGLLIALGGLPIAFAINGASFAAVAVAVLYAGRRRHARASDARSADPRGRSGYQIGLVVRQIAGPLVLDGAISFASGALGVLTILIAVDWLSAGEAFTGVLNAAAGIGGIGGGVAAGLVIDREGPRGMAIGVVAATVGLLVLGLVPFAAAAVAAMVVAYGALVLLDTVNMTTIQRRTAGGTTGRALGLVHTLAAGWMMAGVLIPTAAMAAMGIQAAIVAPALVMAVLGGASLALAAERRAASSLGPLSVPA